MGVGSGLLSAVTGFLQGRDDRAVRTLEEEEEERRREIEDDELQYQDFQRQLEVARDPSLLTGDQEPMSLTPDRNVVGDAFQALGQGGQVGPPSGMMDDVAQVIGGIEGPQAGIAEPPAVQPEVPLAPEEVDEGPPLLSQMIPGITVSAERPLQDLGPLTADGENVRFDPTQTKEAKELRKQEAFFQLLPRDKYLVFIPDVDYEERYYEFQESEEKGRDLEKEVDRLTPEFGEKRAREIATARRGGPDVSAIRSRDKTARNRATDRARSAEDRKTQESVKEAFGVALALAAAGRSRAAIRTGVRAQFGDALSEGDIEAIIQEAVVADLKRQGMEKALESTGDTSVSDILSKLSGG